MTVRCVHSAAVLWRVKEMGQFRLRLRNVLMIASMRVSSSCMLWWFVHFEKRMAPEVEVVVFGYVLFVTLKC